MLYNCFIAGGFVVPVLNVAAGAVGGALHLGGGGDLDADLDLDADVDLDADLDVDVDLDADLDVDAGPGGLGPVPWIDAETGLAGERPRRRRRAPVNVMTLSLTAVVFGAVGRLCAPALPAWAGLLISALSGTLAGWLLGRFVIAPLKYNRAYASGIRDARGKEGVIRLEAREDFTGTVAVLSATGSWVTYNARPAPGAGTLRVGTKVCVTAVDAEKKCCVVRPAAKKE